MDWPDKWKEHEKKFLPFCLFNQPKKKVQDIIKELAISDLKIKEFVRFKIGE